MKKLCILLLLSLSYASAHAGLFEYTLGESTNINASPTQSAGTVESLEYNNYQIDSNTSSDFNTFSNYSNSQDAYYDTVSRGSWDDLQYFYIEELEKLETEAYFIDDIRRQVQISIRNLDNTNSRFYYDLIESLEEIQDREEFVDALVDDYRYIVHTGYDRNNDLVYTLTNLGISDISYDFNRPWNFDRLNTGRYTSPRFSSENYYETGYDRSYNTGNFRSRSFIWGGSSFDRDFNFYGGIYDNNFDTYSNNRSLGNWQNWVNPYLSESGEGYIYIR